MRKRMLSLLLILVLLTIALPMQANAATQVTGGSCGSSLYWTYADGKLTVYGTGAMYDYLYNSTAPWYTYRSGITSVEVASGVTSIGNYAFYNLQELTSVSLPDGLLKIGLRAFEDSDALAELTLPATVNTIGDNAFHGCTALESVNIPQGVSSILTGTFWGCSALKSVVLPDGVTGIGDSAFNGCTALEEIYVPASVTSVGFKPFEGCGALMDHYYGGTAESYKSMVSITGANIRVHGNCESIDTHWVKTEFPATCTIAGYTAEVDPCTAYERNRVVTGSKLGHDWSVEFGWEKDYSACTLTLSCVRDNCSETETHDCEVTTEAFTAANCKEQSYVTYTATYGEYEDEKTVMGDFGPHDWNKATCEAPKTCTLCPATEGEKLGHIFTNYVSNGDATCTQDGTKTAQCDRDECAETDTIGDIGSALDHKMGSPDFKWNEDCSECKLTLSCVRDNCSETETHDCEVTSEAFTATNCKEQSYVTYTASYGAYEDEETVMGDFGPHDWSKATCETPKTCTLCPATEGEKLGHIFTNYVSNGDATCTKDGTKTAVCDHKGCNETHTVADKSSMKEHFDSETDQDHICDTCSKALSACADGNKDHKCDTCSGELTQCTDENTDYTCDICGKELEKSEDPTEPDPTEPDPTEPDPTEPDPTEPDGRDVIRLAGKDRFATAFLVAEQMKEVLGKPRFDAIVLASGTSFADALSGSYLAAVKNAPILLGYKGEYNFQTILYIHANLEYGGTVYILGGEKAVSKEFDDAFQTLGIRYERLAGADRFETNLMVLREAGVKAGDEVLVCTGTDFADSLSGSATGLPILLTYKKLTDSQKAYLATLSGNRFCVVGGTSAVPDSILAEVSQYGVAERLAGENRLLTSVQVAQRYFENPDSAVVAYGWNFPDGLCGGPLAYAMDAPLILTHNKQKYYDIAAQYSQIQGITWGYVLGGDGLVGNEAAVAIFRTGENLPVTMK